MILMHVLSYFRPPCERTTALKTLHSYLIMLLIRFSCFSAWHCLDAQLCGWGDQTGRKEFLSVWLSFPRGWGGFQSSRCFDFMLVWLWRSICHTVFSHSSHSITGFHIQSFLSLSRPATVRARRRATSSPSVRSVSSRRETRTGRKRVTRSTQTPWTGLVESPSFLLRFTHCSAADKQEENS